MSRDLQGRFVLGPRLGESASAAGEDRLLATAGPVRARLRDITGESAQMFRRQGDYRVCVATAERMSGLRDSVPIGTQLTMSAGSAAQVLLAWEEPERMQCGLRGSRFSAVALAAVRRRGWSHRWASGNPASPRCRPPYARPPARSSLPLVCQGRSNDSLGSPAGSTRRL